MTQKIKHGLAREWMEITAVRNRAKTLVNKTKRDVQEQLNCMNLLRLLGHDSKHVCVFGSIRVRPMLMLLNLWCDNDLCTDGNGRLIATCLEHNSSFMWNER
jgi:hypothetical protein